MRRQLSEYKAVILDVDGTLYGNTPLRVGVAFELVVSYLLHPCRMRELRAVLWFRALHNGDARAGRTAASEQDCFELTAERFGIAQERLHQLVQTWMIRRSLKYVRIFRNRELLSCVERLQARGTVIALYSDYPTAEKASVLPGLNPDYQFCSADQEIGCFKPCARGMASVVRQLGLPVEDMLMIGDRDDRDGAAARAVSMDYLIIDRSRQVKDRWRTVG